MFCDESLELMRCMLVLKRSSDSKSVSCAKVKSSCAAISRIKFMQDILDRLIENKTMCVYNVEPYFDKPVLCYTYFLNY